MASSAAAAGSRFDVAAFIDARSGRRVRLESWRHAMNHGIAVGRAMAGADQPYDDVPWFWSDQHGRNIQVAGLPATAGTPALKNFVPAADAPVVQKLRAAGAVILGKTNMHELAFGISGYNPAYNTGPNVGVRNAYDITKMAGGSSSGSGVAIGARMAPAGLGTDTGGSVRIPCALNGCASLRPTIGRYPQAGIAPISHTRDTAGSMGVSMADVDLLDRVITGAPPAAPADLHGVRVGLVNDFLANMDADTKAAFEAALGKLTGAGVTIVPVATRRPSTGSARSPTSASSKNAPSASAMGASAT